MARESLLKGTTYKTASDDRRAVALEEAEKNRTSAFEDLVIVIDDMAESISEAHAKPIDGLNAESAFLQRLTDGLNSNGGRITQHFANGYADSDVVKGELESVRGQLDSATQELEEQRSTQEQLRQSAREASDLQAKLTIAERELDEARAEITRLKREADKPNPLQSKVDELQDEIVQLKSDKSDLQRELTNEKQAHGQTKDELDRLSQPSRFQRQDDGSVRRAVGHDDPLPAEAEPEPAPEPADDTQHQSPHTLAPREEVERRGAARRLADKARGLAPGHSNPRNDTNGSDK